jgi:hypothetical protein
MNFTIISVPKLLTGSIVALRKTLTSLQQTF